MREHLSQSVIPEHICPVCGIVMDRVSALADKPDEVIIPEEGDLTICVGCFTICAFTKDLQLRRATPEEYREYIPTLAKTLVRFILGE